MKPQDIIFFVILVILLWKKNPRYFVLVGLVCMLFAIPLFQLWIFFTAERLIYYATGFLIVGTLLLIIQYKKS